MFTQPSTEPIPNGTKVVNQGFGNRCLICGQYFDECGICNYGHEQGREYYYPPREESKPKKTAMAQKETTKMVVCQVFSGCRCTICGGFFADGDDICASGHEIGQQYPVRDRQTG